MLPGVPPTVQTELSNQANKLGGGSTTAPNPNSANAADVVSLSQKQFNIENNPELASQYPAQAALGRYRHQFQRQNSLPYRLGGGLSNPFWSQAGVSIGRALNNGPIPGGMTGAVIGGGLGALGTGVANLFAKDDSDKMSVKKMALIAALLGGGLGAYSGYKRTQPVMYGQSTGMGSYNPQIHTPYTKTASMWRGDNFSGTDPNLQFVIEKIQQAPGLSFTQKNKMMTGVQHLSSADLRNLKNALAFSSGGAIAAIIAKFLGLGLMGTVASGIGGALIGRAFFGAREPRNFIGQRILTSHDLSGNMY